VSVRPRVKRLQRVPAPPRGDSHRTVNLAIRSRSTAPHCQASRACRRDRDPRERRETCAGAARRGDQNAVAHEDGLGPLWETRRAFWARRKGEGLDVGRRRRDISCTCTSHAGCDTTSGGFSYSWFCECYKEWVGRLKLSLCQDHIASDKPFGDYSGHTMKVIDAYCGDEHLPMCSRFKGGRCGPCTRRRGFGAAEAYRGLVGRLRTAISGDGGIRTLGTP
jgi:hypothetical protein